MNRNKLKVDIIKAMVKLDTLEDDEFLDRLDMLNDMIDAMTTNELLDELDVLRYRISVKA
jgi:hypothetical protein